MENSLNKSTIRHTKMTALISPHGHECGVVYFGVYTQSHYVIVKALLFSLFLM